MCWQWKFRCSSITKIRWKSWAPCHWSIVESPVFTWDTVFTPPPNHELDLGHTLVGIVGKSLTLDEGLGDPKGGVKACLRRLYVWAIQNSNPFYSYSWKQSQYNMLHLIVVVLRATLNSSIIVDHINFQEPVLIFKTIINMSHIYSQST